jgi:LysM repeat protein
VGFAACNRLATPPAKQLLKDADAKVGEGEFLQAINLYEDALDGSIRSADVHYRLALLYDDKMKDPLSAMHHFKRYLTLAPSGAHVSEVKNLMKRDELTLVTTLSGDSVVSRAEAARLKNENLDLQQQLADRRAAETRAAALTKNKPGGVEPGKKAGMEKEGQKGSRSYVVQPGDTLASIARKFYKSSSAWKKIRDSEGKRITDPSKLQPGETVIIP